VYYLQREEIKMKISRISTVAIMLVVIAVAIAGCSSTSPAAPATGEAPSTTTAAGAPSGGSSAPAAGSVVSGANIFGTASPYNWIEYKMSSSGITIFTKYEKSGKCTVRMVGEGLPSGGMTQDCSATGGQQQQNPSEVSSDVTYTFVGIEPVSVPAGTYPAASKYTSTYQGVTSTFWTAPGVPGFVKMQTSDATMELNGWG
jgi:hypothetical protein